MTAFQLRLCFVIACTGLIAGCSQPANPSSFQVTPTQTTLVLRNTSVAYKDLYDFQATDAPVGNLVYLNGKLYGTTDGGNGHCPETGQGCGTIFSVNVNGTNHAIVYTFTGRQDGGFPVSLVAANGNLYGSTVIGGATGLGGLVFEATPAGSLRVLHEFGAANDGYYPGGLLYADGALYGITIDGGSHCKACGTVFRLTLAGRETWIHTFGRGFDGVKPTGSLIAVGGTFYGATTEGGPYLSGTIFAIDAAGKERVLHGFGLYNDRFIPSAPLAAVNGTLYGLASGGTYGNGAIFSLATDGTKERVLYSFQGSAIGNGPNFGLVAENATVYGVTTRGGVYGNPTDGGTIFSLAVNASSAGVLHSFGNWPDGYDPEGPLVNVNGTLYGMTTHGGKHGGGMIFSLSGAR